VTRFFHRNAELEKLNENQVCNNFTEMPMLIDAVIDF